MKKPHLFIFTVVLSYFLGFQAFARSNQIVSCDAIGLSVYGRADYKKRDRNGDVYTKSTYGKLEDQWNVNSTAWDRLYLELTPEKQSKYSVEDLSIEVEFVSKRGDKKIPLGKFLLDGAPEKNYLFQIKNASLTEMGHVTVGDWPGVWKLRVQSKQKDLCEKKVEFLASI